MMKLRQKIFGGFGSDRAGVDPAERVAAGDLGRRGTIRPQSTPAAFPTRRSEPPAGGGVAADHERNTVSKTFQSLSQAIYVSLGIHLQQSRFHTRARYH